MITLICVAVNPLNVTNRSHSLLKILRKSDLKSNKNNLIITLKTMTKALYKNWIISFCTILMLQSTSCQKKDDVAPVSQEKYLTADSSKSWNMIANTHDTVKNLSPSCKTSSIINKDNKMIFLKGGVFQFDNGTIQEDPTCQNDCCGDFANLLGKWVIRNDTLVITANARIDNGQITQFTQAEEILKGKILKLNNSELVVSNVYVATLIPVR
jgi:hypothetical protein